MEEKETRFLESSDSDIKKPVANAVAESTRKSAKFEDEKSFEQTLEIQSYTNLNWVIL